MIPGDRRRHHPPRRRRHRRRRRHGYDGLRETFGGGGSGVGGETSAQRGSEERRLERAEQLLRCHRKSRSIKVFASHGDLSALVKTQKSKNVLSRLGFAVSELP